MKLNVLVVDDETPICEWLVYCIRKASHEYVVSSASNGEEAYEKILGLKPDLVFTDIRMPGMDGLELMKKTLEVLPFTVFAILTNYAEFSYAKQALSLGAREYFLKSELRAADLETLLQQVLEAKRKTLSSQKDEVFHSGCIDLYNFYSGLEQPDHADRFWEKHGMWKDVPYQVLCLTGGSRPDQWQEVAAIAAKLRSGHPEDAYLAAASELGLDYVVVQAKSGLSSFVRRVADLLSHRGQMGVSSALADRADFARALKEASSAKLAAFFENGGSLVEYGTIARRSALDRKELLERREAILARIPQRSYTEAGALLQQWFHDIASPGSGDIQWAVDLCRRMVLSVEEQYHQELKGSHVEMVVQHSAADCCSRCLQMLTAMDRHHTARCSPSIAAAVEYIHAHYHENISMAEVARQIYRSPEYFSRQFKEEVGENFNTYLTLYRLDRAQELLDRSDLRIAEIAEKVGYVTPGYFSRIYKKYKGISPEQSRMSKK